MRQSAGFVASLLVLFLAQVARAAPIHFVEVDSHVQVGFGVTQDGPFFVNTGQVDDDDFAQQTLTAALAAATATATFRIDNGALRSTVSATGDEVDFNLVTAVANTQLQYFDTITLTSASPDLPVGSEVSYSVGLSTSYAFTGTCNLGGGPETSVASVNAVLTGSIAGTGGLQVRDSTCDTDDILGPVSKVVQGTIGQELTIHSLMSLNATVVGPTSTGVDAFNTVFFTIDPLGDFTYTSSSGNTYFSQASTPVPEPGTLLLLGAGAAALTARARRRRRI